MPYKLIESVEQLKQLATDRCECFIALNGGLRSSKTIDWDPDEKTFWVLNEIDDSEQELTEDQLYTESNIGEAIDKHALYQY